MHATLTLPAAAMALAPAASAAESLRHAPGDTAGADEARSAGPAPAIAVDSTALLQGHKAVAIRHNGALYRLQATRLGKLILTK